MYTWTSKLNETQSCTVQSQFRDTYGLFNREQNGISEPFSVTNLPVYLINKEQIGIIEQFCDGQKVP